MGWLVDCRCTSIFQKKKLKSNVRMHGLCDNFLEVQDKKKTFLGYNLCKKNHTPTGQIVTGFLMPSLVCLGCLVLTRKHSLFTSARIFGKVPIPDPN